MYKNNCGLVLNQR